ncbi:MAG: ATP-dependent RNA helicase [Treponema sp.]|nr:ATP-dependent RNA helicase [Treponema sp.]
MAIEYKKLPVYEQKQRILDTLKDNQVIVVQSPTGSGKTTQIPVILYEAGYAQSGTIAVTQPRRIAALSVSEFISKQLNTTYPGLVGYKMRFEDKTDATTKIKIMTDGILLQEMKLDPWLSKYSVIMVDEAHERSLNIDFVLGLLKRVLAERKDFRVIVSSATMNAEAFSAYFDGCPIVTIDTITYPVTIVYDTPSIPASTISEAATDALLTKICNTVDRILANNEPGGILIFLPGEKIIKDCLWKLDHSPFSRKIHTLPLYGRLAKEEQEKVFAPAPFGKKKVIISTNIAETSVTISDITTVIDAGLAKLNFYNPRTFTSSLNETAISKASCNQRKGRAGRTQPGICYRLYSRKDYDTRPMYTTEEIYRTDLSEVVLRMAELGITDFQNFDFISPPGIEGIIGAVDTLNMLQALDSDNTLSSIGKLMVEFPLEPRISRIIIEAIMKYPNVLEEALIAAAFLSANSPFLLPQGEEMEARKAHHNFRDMQGDFVSYLHIFKGYTSSPDKEKFCKKNYLDDRVMAEIENINVQLKDIVSKMNIPIMGGGNKGDYLCCIASGMIQFVCIRTGKNTYRSLTADKICIHPGSVLFRQDPLFIVAGEIVRTSRMYAMSVSPLTKSLLHQISPTLLNLLENTKSPKDKKTNEKEKTSKKEKESKQKLQKDETISGIKVSSDSITLGNQTFDIKKVKGKKQVQLSFDRFIYATTNDLNSKQMKQINDLKGKIIYSNNYELLTGEKLELIIKLAKSLNLRPIDEKDWNRKLNINIYEKDTTELLVSSLENVLKVAIAKKKSREYGFICLFTDDNGNYWYKVSRGFITALNESLSSLETLAEKTEIFTEEQLEKINNLYRLLTSLYKD